MRGHDREAVTGVERQIVLLARLRAELLDLYQRGKVSLEVYRWHVQELDQLNFERARTLSSSLPELIEESRRAGVGANLAAFDGELRRDRLETIRGLRRLAVESGEVSLDLGSLDPAAVRIPLRGWSWHARRAELEGLVARMGDPGASPEEVAAAARRFFGNEERFALPVELPRLTAGLIQRLIAARAVASADAQALVSDLNVLEATHRLVQGQVLSQTLEEGHVPPGLLDPPTDLGLRLLHSLVSSERLPEGLDLDVHVIQWSGPAFPALVSAWYPQRSAEPRERRSRKVELICARTGIDPEQEPQAWRVFLAHQRREEKESYSELVRIVGRHRILYELAVVLSGGSVLGDSAAERWWRILERARRTRPAATSLAPAPTPPRPGVQGPAPAPTPEGEGVEVHESLLAEDEVEHLEVAAAVDAPAKSPDDELVEEKSTWSVYLKPFLSENWLGLMGIFSLMAAWMFLTLWLWDKGQYYRILMGVVPLLALSLGSAFIARFIQKLEGASPRAVALFAALSFLSIPFNFALGSSVLSLGGAVGVSLGVVLAGLYAITLPFIAARIDEPFGFNPVRFLLEMNSLLYVTPVVFLLFGQGALGPSMAATAFLTYLALVRGLLRAHRGPASRFRFAWFLFVTTFVLVNGIDHVYFRTLPSVLTVAVLLEVVAPAITYFSRRTPASIAVAAGVSILGVLLSLNEPRWLPLTLALATGFWLYLKRDMEARWPNEVLALHLLGLVGSVAYWLQAPLVSWPLAFVPAFGLLVWLERRWRETRAVTWSLPVYLCATVYCSHDASGVLWRGVSGLLLAAGLVYAYGRYSRAYRAGFWFLNLVLFTVLPWLALGMDPALDEPFVAVYLASAALLWGLASTVVRDALTRAHRTFVLWCLGGPAWGACVAVALPVVGREGGLSGLVEPVWGLAVGLTLAALALAAKRSQSPFPVYLGLALAGLAGAAVKDYLGIGGRSGTLTGSLGLALVGVAALLQRRRVWQDGEPDLLFKVPFPARGATFLWRPLEVAALGMAVFAVGKALTTFVPVLADPRPAVSLALASLLLAILAWRFNSVALGYLPFVPMTGLLASLSLSLPASWPWHSALVWLGLLNLGRDRLAAPGSWLAPALAKPLSHVTTALTWLTVPGALLVYVPMVEAGLVPLLGWVGLVTFFTHRWLVRRWRGFVHLVLAHWALGWTLGAWLVASSSWAPSWNFETWVLVWSGGLAVALLLVASPLELVTAPLGRAYSRGAAPWITVEAVFFALWAVLLVLFSGFSVPALALHLAAAWVLLHLSNRRWVAFWLLLLKGVVCMALGFFLHGDPVGGPFVGLVAFYVLEVLLARLDRRVPVGVQASPFAPRGEPRPWALGLSLQLFMAFLLLTHLYLYFDSQEPAHFWLYGLIPLCFLARKAWPRAYLTYAGFGLFAYTNAFATVELQPLVERFDLTQLHLISLAFVVSTGVYLMLGPYLRRGLLR